MINNNIKDTLKISTGFILILSNPNPADIAIQGKIKRKWT
jgi:hypothetical protein